MKEQIQKNIKRIQRLIRTVGSHHTGAYAAQSAYFFVLSMIPIILLLLTAVQYTPLTKADVMTAVVRIFPKSVDGLIVSIVNQVYNQSRTIIPITAIASLWSAGKGVLAVTYGLNSIYESHETRNYFYLRFRSTFYTVVFIIAIVLSLLLSVFGNSLSILIVEHLPFMERLINLILRIRTLFSFVILTLFWILVYRFLPNRKDLPRYQIPGAVFTACGWLLISFVFSVYLDIFTGFSDMYGSLTTIILIMLWLYFCMYTVLLGGEVNVLYQKFSGKFLEMKERNKDRMKRAEEERDLT